MNQKHNIDLLVVSCDAYSDLWGVFFTQFFKSWENCPLDIYLLTNQKAFNAPNVKTLKIGPDTSWSDNLLKGLTRLKKDYVLIILEDILIKNNVSLNFFCQISNWINDNQPNYLRLTNSHKPKKHDSLVGKLPDKTPYKTSTMPCIWKRSTLREILKKGESAWDFEIKGSKRAFEHDGFYAVYKDLIRYNNGVIKGKWRKSILKEGNEYGLNINTISRPVMTTVEELVYSLRKYRSILFNRLPNKFRRVLKRQ